MCVSTKFEIVKGRTFLVPASAPVSLLTPHQSPVPSSSSPVFQAKGNAESRPDNSIETMPENSPAPAAMVKESRHINKEILMAIILVPVVIGLIMIFSICTWLYRRVHSSASPSQAKTVRRNADPDISDVYLSMTLGPLMNRLNSLRVSKKKGFATSIEYSILQTATNSFSSDNIIGDGGFGCVYKARFDDDSFAAVKKLDEGGKQAEHEFQNEVDLMSKIRHPNLVSLLGFCTHEKTRLLVYELMQNGSLEDQLHGPLRGSALTWYLRMKIALDSARGLEHLHEHCHPSVIHRDFKSSNILLDASFNAKLSDFGLAVTAAGCAGINVELLGTLGYVAPEYLLEGKLTEKSDVYAFGIVLLELIIGRKPIDKSLPTEFQSLVSWAMPQLKDRTKLPSIVDPTIKDTMNLKHLYQVAAIAVLCVQPEPSYRPLIADVVHSLIPLVPVELGGTLRVADAPSIVEMKSFETSNSTTKIVMNP
ncbi:hypothetical protein KI387_028478 [Taxus chinensis]|uniref:Protein kinase domain-containing protein n=1 Tax=Taxus chinensis TaxID=29808 RepID=A0AA38C823_TAXCH|nr:hypothetical protein KI387_028478 [Taxus chinensis]